MSRIYLKPIQDASIYKVYSNLNTGFDEILEVGKQQNSLDRTNGPVRSLIQYDLTDLKGAPTTSAVFLNLKIANAEKLHQNELIYIYPVSKSWTEGSGYFEQRPFVSVDGVTWLQHSSGSSWENSGSDFLNVPVVSASVTDIVNDELRINITDVIQPMMSGSSLSANYGILLKFSNDSENDVYNRGNIKFFSRQTHTVHEPLLELSWLNQTFITGSLKTPSSFDIEIVPKNLKVDYQQGEILRVYFIVRDKYPLKTYSNTTRFNNKYYLPSSSIYSVRDVGSGTTIIPFDVYSHIDCDSSGSYVKIDTRPLYKNRFYDLTLKVTLEEEIYFSTPYRFKVL